MKPDLSQEVPELTVVVPSVNGWSDLEGCLEALDRQEGDPRLEIIVADRVGDAVRSRLRDRPRTVRLLQAPPETTIPELRAIAFTEAKAPIVGVIEDHVIVPPDWARRMLDAHSRGAAVVGGSVENLATGSLVEWASFLCEYSHCLAPSAGEAEWLTGNNVTYRRELLERHWEVIEEGRWENRLHDALREAGVRLVCHPEIRVAHKKHFTFKEYMSQRYLYARSFAGMRTEGWGLGGRLLYAVATLALPPLLAARIFAAVWKSGLYRTQLLASLPLMVPFVSSWSAGETIGALFGAGDALARVD